MDLIISTYELSNVTIDIFPNPTSEKINLIIPPELNFSIKLFDLTGQFLFFELNSHSIQINHLQEGIYLLVVTDLSINNFIREKIIVTE